MNQTMNKTLGSALLITLLALAGCGKNTGVGGTAGDAETATQKANELIAQELKLDDPQDFEDAKRGFIAAPEGSACDTACPMRLHPRNIKRMMFSCVQCGQCLDECERSHAVAQRVDHVHGQHHIVEFPGFFRQGGSRRPRLYRNSRVAHEVLTIRAAAAPCSMRCAMRFLPSSTASRMSLRSRAASTAWTTSPGSTAACSNASRCRNWKSSTSPNCATPPA